MDNSIINVKEKCCGCRLCENKCPFYAIKLKESKEGFLYPEVNDKLCKNCGLCKKKCPVINDSELNDSQIETYMMINKNEKDYQKSASGGFATLLSKYVINTLKGIVYGVIIDSEYNVKHVRAENEEELEQFQGSKYVQSDLDMAYKKIKEDLKRGKVLFIGTPCQVDAIKRYTENSNNLLTCDLVCHGVASPGYFKKYIQFLSKKHNSKVKEFRFRNKCSYDKCGYIESITFENKHKIKVPADMDLFYSNFIYGENHRFSCYKCKYKVNARVGDFTIGDVSSWEDYYDFYPEKSPSLIIINNKRAKQIFDKLNEKMDYREILLKKEQKLNKALSKQKEIPEIRKKIYELYNNFGRYDKEHMKNMSGKMKIKIIGKRLIPFSLRIKIKKLKREDKNEQGA